MSDESYTAVSRLDKQPENSKRAILPGQLEISAYEEESEQPFTCNSERDESAPSTSRLSISRLNNYTPQKAEVNMRNHITTMTPSGTDASENVVMGDEKNGPSSTRLSFKRISSGNDQPRLSRVHPVFSDSIFSDAPESDTSLDTNLETVVKTRMTVQKIYVSSKNLQAVKPARKTQHTGDPTIYHMVYFRTKKEIEYLFFLPPVSLWGRRLNIAIFVLILSGIAALAMQTCDGPNFGSTDPGYPYLPSKEFHVVCDNFFTGVYTLEFLGRIFKTRKIRSLVRDPCMWFDLIGLSPWYISQLLKALGAEGFDSKVNLLRLVRTIRLASILRHYEQTEIIYQAIKASLRPLSITMFFLFTLVMVLATAIYYAEPCFNVETCTFTDIFNAAYFVMVTVATVGYGNQVPSLKNPGSLILTMIAMILGQIYFSMPVAIIGNNFQLTYESFQLTKKKKKARFLDASLVPFNSQTFHTHAKRLCDIQYQILNVWSGTHSNILEITRIASRSITLTVNLLELEKNYLETIKEGTNRLLEAHSEAIQLLRLFIPRQRTTFNTDLTSDGHGVLGKMYVTAKRAMTKARVLSAHHPVILDPSTASQTFRGRIWLLLEVPDSSRFASVVNQTIIAVALFSTMLFFSQSLRELAASGVETRGCKAVAKSYCRDTGVNAMDPACFLRSNNGSSDFTQQISFSCFRETESRTCYGNGLNFGSLDSSALACVDVFFSAGVNSVCYRPQCRATYRMIFDMGPYWIFFEWWLGVVFTLELVLRFYVSPNWKQFWRNVYVIFDVVAIIPFISEVFELIVTRIQPDFAIVAAGPSFSSTIRMLKILRILKLTRHFRGTKLLVYTAMRIWKPLVIPLFFLFTGCIIAGALFYEIERGKECFVGEICMWWDENVLTPELAYGLPLGKRILIQDRLKSTIIDMIHSTWLSYTTLTSVGYGDLVPRTSIGKFFDIFVIIVATIYSAMPLSLVGKQFYALYEKHMEKMIVKQGGSSVSWHTNNTMTILSQQKQVTKPPAAREPEPFALSPEHLVIVHEFESMKLTILNFQRTLEKTFKSSDDILGSSSTSKGCKILITSRRSMASGPRNSVRIDQTMELKSIAIMDTLMRFSQVVEKLQEAPVDFEASEEHDTFHSDMFSQSHSLDEVPP
ncbi:putative Ion transport domain, voltage-dependent channel domain superfamily [Plasmopara halstedii]